MHKIGLKLWSVNTENFLEEAKKLYSQRFFDYIELYVLPDSLDCLAKWKNLPIPYVIHCAHSAHGFNLAEKAMESRNRQIYAQVKIYADELNASHIIFHGGVDGSIAETARQLASFRESRALIENKPMKPLASVTSMKECRGYSVEELETVIHAAHCGFCLDFGHAICAANSMHVDPYAYIRRLMSFSPKLFHLSDVMDMHSEYDAHPNLGTGSLDLPQIFRMIPADATITIETNKSDGLRSFCDDVKIVNSFSLGFQKVKMADADDLLGVANDPQVRQNSFSTALISREEHLKWLTKKTQDPDCFFYTIRKAGDFVGSIRIELDGVEHVISISLSKEFRSQGFGAWIIKNFCEKSGLQSVVAYIKEGNIPSLKSFQKAGFSQVGTTKEDVLRLVWEKK